MACRTPLQFMSKDQMVCVCLDLEKLMPSDMSRHQISLCKDYLGWISNHPYKRVKGYLDAALSAAGLRSLAETTYQHPTEETLAILKKAIAKRESVCLSTFLNRFSITSKTIQFSDAQCTIKILQRLLPSILLCAYSC